MLRAVGLRERAGAATGKPIFNIVFHISMLKVLSLSALCVAGVAAQDPATGWMAYAQGSIPSGAERITKLEVRGDDRVWLG